MWWHTSRKQISSFGRNGRVHLNRRWASVQSTTGSRGVRISGSNAGYTMFWGSVKGTGYPLHSPVFPSLPLPCVTVCHHISARVYVKWPLGCKRLKQLMNWLLRKVMKLVKHQGRHSVVCSTQQRIVTSSPLPIAQFLGRVSTSKHLGGNPVSLVCQHEAKRK